MKCFKTILENILMAATVIVGMLVVMVTVFLGAYFTAGLWGWEASGYFSARLFGFLVLYVVIALGVYTGVLECRRNAA